MKGSLLPRGPGRWRLAVDAPREPGAKRRQIVRHYRGTKKDAQVALAQLVVEAQRMPTEPAGTVGEMLTTWLDLAEQTPSSRRTAEDFITRYLRPRLGGMPLARLTPVVIDRCYSDLLRQGGADGGPLKPSTVRRVHGILSVACAAAVRWGMLSTNPCRDASPPGAERPKHRAPTADDVRAVLDLARHTDPDMYTFLALAADTGARRGELCGLRWEDLEGSEIRVRRAIGMAKTGIYVKPTKTGRERTVTLAPSTLALLEEHRGRLEEAGHHTAEGYIFSTAPDGAEPWRPDYATHRLVDLRKRVGVSFRLHDLRHYSASTAINAGVPVTAVARRLGHARPSTTADMYGTPSTEEDRRAAELIAASLEP